MKNFFEHISPRWIRIIYSVFALLVLGVTSYNFMRMMFWRVPSNDQCRWVQNVTDTTRVHILTGNWEHRPSSTGLYDGDILMAVDGQPIRKASDARRTFDTAQPGDTLRLTIERDLRERSIAYVAPDTGRTRKVHFFDRNFEVLVISDIVEGGVTDRAGVRDGDILLRIDSISVNNYYGPSYLLNIHSAGSTAEFLVDRDGTLLTFEVRVLKTINYLYLAQFILGLGFLLVGYFVVMARPQGGIQRKFARFGIFAMFFFGFSSIAAGEMYDPLWKVLSLVALSLLARILAPPSFVSFFLHFPVRRRITERRWFTPVLYGVSFLGAAGWAVHLFRLLGDYLPRPIALTFYFLPVGFFFAGLGIFLHSYFTRVESEDRRALRPILQSVIIGVIALLYTVFITSTYPFAIFLQPYLLLPAQIGRAHV